MRKNPGVMVLSAGLIGLYLIVKNPSGFKTLLTDGPNGGAKLVQAFQGR